MYPWKSVIQIKKGASPPVYLQVANKIIKEICEGRLSPGQKLPGARLLGDLLKLNRKTIVAAMEELESQGWLEVYPQKGTFISVKLPEPDYKALNSKALSGNLETSSIAIEPLPLLEPLHIGFKNKKFIDDGVPDVKLAPLKSLFRHYRPLISKRAFTSLLKYNHVEGDLDLRTSLRSYLHTTRGITTSVEGLFITRGSQMAIYLTIAALLKPGDFCITAFPGYPLVDNIIHHLGGNSIHVPVDDEGMDVRAVEKICKKKTIKLLYITPHHHYPTTVTLSPVRRIELLQLALKYNFFILEDDYAYDFHYDNMPVLPLASLDKSGRVIYIGSFSKCLAPAIRVGYFVAPPAIMTEANKLRRIIDRQGDPMLERSLSEFIKSGDLQRHLKKIVKTYRGRRNHFCLLLQDHLANHISFKKPEGGMSVWVTFKKANVLPALLQKLETQGYQLDTEPVFIEKFNSIRMGFASLSAKEMETFIVTMKRILTAR